tara:strand:+ start:732 stop:845 length:114 start_codon:yes stop_codon:yes gene_type:complete
VAELVVPKEQPLVLEQRAALVVGVTVDLVLQHQESLM